MAKKIITGSGCTQSVDFKANVKCNTAPIIIEVFLDDTGEETYILANGNTQPKISYDNLWGGLKGKVLPKNTKGESVDPRVNWIK